MSADDAVLYYSDVPDLVGELATAAETIATARGTRAIDLEMDKARDGVSAQSKLVVMRRTGEPLSNNPELVANAIIAVATSLKPSAILVGSSRTGRQIAARIAVRLRMGAMSDVRNITVVEGGGEGNRISGERTVYAGKFLAKVSSSLPCVATVPQGAYEKRSGPSGPTETMEVEVSAKVRRVETRPKPKASVDLKSASIIVSAGRGFKKKEDLALVEKLAAAMGGVVGSSRPLTSDLGWLGEEHHIGLTGFYVHPDLYLAIGISGQLQHVAGIKDSKIIAAINKDKQAPIFQVADYGVVGDLYQIIPVLLKLLETTTTNQ